jgi:hypothetical protein
MAPPKSETPSFPFSKTMISDSMRTGEFNIPLQSTTEQNEEDSEKFILTEKTNQSFGTGKSRLVTTEGDN